MSKQRTRNRSKKANLQLFFNEIIRPLDEIDHIRAHIHRISFTTNYPYDRIAEKLGTEFQIKPISKHSKSNSSIYKFEGYTNFLDFKVHVMTGLIGSMIKKTDRFSRITIVPKVPINPRRHRSMICKHLIRVLLLILEERWAPFRGLCCVPFFPWEICFN